MTVAAHVMCGPNITGVDLREAFKKLDSPSSDPLDQVWSLGWQAWRPGSPVHLEEVGAPETWARFCQGDGKKFCCSRNGCHPLCNCTI